MEIYLVGGAVRDTLLERVVVDRDWVVCGATSQQMLDAGFALKDEHFQVYLDPNNGDEYALARTEQKRGSGHRGFDLTFGPDITLEDDLRRRDFTVNAMALGSDGTLIDPFGGQADLESATLRHVSPAFVEDPLRVWRAAQFSARLGALGFDLAPATLTLMIDMCAKREFRELSAQRLWAEIEKVLATETLAPLFKTLHAAGALRSVVPALHALWDEEASVWSVLLDDPERGAFDKLALLLAAAQRAQQPNDSVAKALGVPRHLATRAAHLMAVESLLHEFTTAGLLKTMELVGALRQSDRHVGETAGQALEPPQLMTWKWRHIADASPHRLGQAEAMLQRASAMQRCIERTRSLDLEKIKRSDLSGKVKGEQIRAARLAAIEAELEETP